VSGWAPAVVTLSALLLLAASVRGQAPDPALGRKVYEANCAICHGESGDGKGHGAHHFASAPRDLTAGRYKFRSTASGQLPTDDDLRRSIAMGIPGTAMVPQNHLTDADVQAVIDFVKSLSPRFVGAPPPRPVPISPAPPRTPDAIARGRKAYEKGECRECHGPEGHGDGPSAKDLKIKPSDLTRRPLKGGPTPRDIARTLFTGLDGTPMPSYHLVLDDDEIWDLAYYVDSLGTPPVVTDDERAGWHVVKMHQRREPAPPR
jgi:mono/diheme cytochrome c family protein